jgi:acyl-CoA synthetase (AMP-forming)/AMP-acid ligase II
MNRWANALMGLGVRRSDRVATLLGNCAELVWTYLACFKLGAATVPLFPLREVAGWMRCHVSW